MNDNAVVPPADFQASLKTLLELERVSGSRAPDVYALRRRLGLMLGDIFKIGGPESHIDDETVAVRIGRGVDQANALVGWGAVVESNPTIEFPGADHQVRYCVRLPLANGKFVEYPTALVSMPFTAGGRIGTHLEEAKRTAIAVGWTAEELQSWSWFAPGETTLWLYKRTCRLEDINRAWPSSFKRWLIENEKKLLKTSGNLGRLIVRDLLTCPHLPLDLADYDDFRERYLREVSPEKYPNKWDSSGLLYSKLIEKWKKDTLDMHLD